MIIPAFFLLCFTTIVYDPVDERTFPMSRLCPHLHQQRLVVSSESQMLLRLTTRPRTGPHARACVIGKGNASVCTFPAQISFSVWIHQIEINTLSMSRTSSIRGNLLSPSWTHFVCVGVCVRVRARTRYGIY